jgi:hypothetical protein
LLLTFPDVFGSRHIPEIELRRDRERERLETPAAGKLEFARKMPDHPISPGVLAMHVEREHDWRDDRKRIAFSSRKLRGLVPVFEMLVRTL